MTVRFAGRGVSEGTVFGHWMYSYNGIGVAACMDTGSIELLL